MVYTGGVVVDGVEVPASSPAGVPACSLHVQTCRRVDMIVILTLGPEA